ncbi:MAG: hypothetical protein K9K37_04305 [Desulfocapsa sp.]|nr:hypothetical protein [Desulfocapsa sp.]
MEGRIIKYFVLGGMLSLSRQLPEGQLPVLITMEEDMNEFFIPMGRDKVVTVYSER